MCHYSSKNKICRGETSQLAVHLWTNHCLDCVIELPFFCDTVSTSKQCRTRNVNNGRYLHFVTISPLLI
jgi:hypothetical protein